MLSVVLPSVFNKPFMINKCRYAECRYAECHYAECRYAECYGACILQSPKGKLLLKKVFNNCWESLRSIKGSIALSSEKSPSTGAKSILTLAPWAARQQIGLN